MGHKELQLYDLRQHFGACRRITKSPKRHIHEIMHAEEQNPQPHKEQLHMGLIPEV